MIAYLKNNFKVWWFGSLYVFLTSGFLTTLYVYFIKRNISLNQILMAEFLAALTVALVVFFKRQWHTQRSLYWGFSFTILALSILFLPLPASYLLPIYTVICYLGTISFFIIFNVLFFRSKTQGENLQQTTFYWAIMIVSGIIGPLIGGYILAKASLFYFALLTFVILICLFFLVPYLPKETFKVNRKDLLTTIKGFRGINLLDGALHKVGTITITLMSLKFIHNEFDFGKYLSVVSIVALIFSLRTAKISDRLNKRMVFMWPLSIAAAFTTAALYFANNFWLYILLALTLKALTVMVEPMRTNILQDKADKNNPLTWISREFFLNSGRSVLWLLAATLWYFNWQSVLFILMGLLYLVFPIMVHHKKIYATTN